MNERKYFDELNKKRASRLNEIIHAVNERAEKADIGLQDEVEKMFYDRLIKQAKEHEKKYGFWPTFEVDEIESDDPKLDIYNSEV